MPRGEGRRVCDAVGRKAAVKDLADNHLRQRMSHVKIT